MGSPVGPPLVDTIEVILCRSGQPVMRMKYVNCQAEWSIEHEVQTISSIFGAPVEHQYTGVSKLDLKIRGRWVEVKEPSPSIAVVKTVKAKSKKRRR